MRSHPVDETNRFKDIEIILPVLDVGPTDRTRHPSEPLVRGSTCVVAQRGSPDARNTLTIGASDVDSDTAPSAHTTAIRLRSNLSHRKGIPGKNRSSTSEREQVDRLSARNDLCTVPAGCRGKIIGAEE
ncbi:hypothetical protein GCM10027408_11950 [Microbacterium tumbae]